MKKTIVQPSQRKLRPAIISASVHEQTLLTSVEQARSVLGADWAQKLAPHFAKHLKPGGVWVLPHPDNVDAVA